MRVAAFFVLLAACSAHAQAVTIAWSPVGNPGNAADTADGDGTAVGVQNFGAIGYNYNIGTYDVTNSQYVEFLNAKVPLGEVADPLGLYNSGMSNATYGGINFNPGAPVGSMFSTISGTQNHPVNYVTWYDAIRFANWMNNGQGNGDTETGSYTLLGGTPTPSNASSITRNAGARIVLPNENEWYKAAYYNPATHSYFLFPTSSNTEPTASGPGAIVNSANWNNTVGNLTDVGAYSGTTSPYGAFDMAGNVGQWDETKYLTGEFIAQLARGVRSGSFSNVLFADPGRSSFVTYGGPSYSGTAGDIVGFRLAMVPEPSSVSLAALGLAGLAAWGWRRAFTRPAKRDIAE